MKMYILIKESAPVGLAIVAAAHASLAAYLAFAETSEVKEWLSGPFRKVVCMVSDAEFDEAAKYEDRVVLTESALGGQEIALAFRPRRHWPDRFRRFRLYA